MRSRYGQSRNTLYCVSWSGVNRVDSAHVYTCCSRCICNVHVCMEPWFKVTPTCTRCCLWPSHHWMGVGWFCKDVYNKCSSQRCVQFVCIHALILRVEVNNTIFDVWMHIHWSCRAGIKHSLCSWQVAFLHHWLAEQHIRTSYRRWIQCLLFAQTYICIDHCMCSHKMLFAMFNLLHHQFLLYIGMTSPHYLGLHAWRPGITLVYIHVAHVL